MVTLTKPGLEVGPVTEDRRGHHEGEQEDREVQEGEAGLPDGGKISRRCVPQTRCGLCCVLVGTQQMWVRSCRGEAAAFR